MIIACKTTGRRLEDKRVNIAWHAAVPVSKHTSAITSNCLGLCARMAFEKRATLAHFNDNGLHSKL